MFRENIRNPIDPIPDEYIAALERLSCEPDYSLTCLGIALLKSRIENYGGIKGVYYNYANKTDCVEDFVHHYATLSDYPMLCYYIYNINDIQPKYIETRLPEFKEKKSIAELIKERSGCECTVLYHEKKNCAAIFVNTADMRVYHVLMSFIPLYFPSIFAAYPMQAEDYEVIKPLTKDKKDYFIKAVQDAVQPWLLEFRRLQLNQMLKAMHERKINDALNDVKTTRDRAENCLRQYHDIMQALRECSIRYEGMKAVEVYDEIEEGFTEYLATNPSIHNMKMNGSELSFTVATRLNNYNADAYATFKQRGAIYDGNYRGATLLNVFKEKANRIRLLDHIFNESPDFAIKIAGNYRLDFGSEYMGTTRGFNYANADPMYNNYLPNPHIELFGCLGDYSERVHKALKNRNYIGAVEMCIASAGSVNLDETEQTFRPFIGWLMSSEKKILIAKDGTEMTPEEALIWIVDKEKENETN